MLLTFQSKNYDMKLITSLYEISYYGIEQNITLTLPAWRYLFNVHIKAGMNNIPLETAAIFFLATLFLKRGISSEYVIIDFICMGLRYLLGTRTKMGRFLRITVKRVAPCQCLDGHVKEPYEMSVALGARPLWGAVLLFIQHFLISRNEFLLSKKNSWYQEIFCSIEKYFLISRNRFLDIKKWLLDIKNSNSWYQKIEFLISKNAYLDIKKSIYWYQEIFTHFFI